MVEKITNLRRPQPDQLSSHPGDQALIVTPADRREIQGYGLVAREIFSVLAGDEDVPEAILQANKQVVARHSQLREVTRVQGDRAGIPDLYLDPVAVVTGENLITLSDAAAYRAIAIAENLSFFRFLLLNPTSPIEDALDDESLARLLEIAERWSQTSRKGFKFTGLWKGFQQNVLSRQFRADTEVVKPALDIAIASIGALPSLRENILTAKRLYLDNQVDARNFIAQLEGKRRELIALQETLGTNTSFVNQQLARIAQRLQGFTLDSDPGKLEGTKEELTKIDLQVARIAEAYGRSLEIPDEVLVFFNTWNSLITVRPQMRAILADTRGAAQAALLNALNGFLVTHTVLSNALDLGRIVRRRMMYDASNKLVAQAKGEIRRAFLSLPDVLGRKQPLKLLDVERTLADLRPMEDEANKAMEGEFREID